MDDQQHPVAIPPLPFPWSAVRYCDPQTQEQGRHNVAHLRMEGAFSMGKWRKPAGYILCASPVTVRDPRYWQLAETVTCQTCLGRVEWFLMRYAALLQKQRQKQ
jgi:hypothetical protein